jgi:hypothetical protein
MMLRRLVLVAAAMCAAWVTSASAEEAFVGRWAATTEVCATHGGDSAANSALVATASSLWWYDGVCRIGKMYKTKAVYVQAHCDGKDVAVTLDAAGDRLRVTWAGKAQELTRCK